MNNETIISLPNMHKLLEGNNDEIIRNIKDKSLLRRILKEDAPPLGSFFHYEFNKNLNVYYLLKEEYNDEGWKWRWTGRKAEEGDLWLPTYDLAVKYNVIKNDDINTICNRFLKEEELLFYNFMKQICCKSHHKVLNKENLETEIKKIKNADKDIQKVSVVVSDNLIRDHKIFFDFKEIKVKGVQVHFQQANNVPDSNILIIPFSYGMISIRQDISILCSKEDFIIFEEIGFIGIDSNSTTSILFVD